MRGRSLKDGVGKALVHKFAGQRVSYSSSFYQASLYIVARIKTTGVG